MMRHGAWLWLLAILIAAVYLSFRAATGIVLESNILALLPRAERDAAAQSVQDRIAESFSRRVIFLVGDASPGKAAAAARKLSAALERSGTIASLTSKLDPDAQQRMGAAYFSHRSGLLSDADRKALLAGQGQMLVSRALSVLYGAGGFANAKLIAHDPFLLLPAFLIDLPVPKSRFALDDGVLSVRSRGLTYVLVSADLAGDPFSMKFQENFETTVSTALSGLKAETPDLNIVRTGAVFYAHDSASEAMQETSIIGLASLVATLALIFLVFRGLRPIVLGFLASASAFCAPSPGRCSSSGRSTRWALLLGVSLIGISVDYSLQYFCEYFDPDAVRSAVAVAARAARGRHRPRNDAHRLLHPSAGAVPGSAPGATISLIGLAGSVLTVVLWYPLLDRKQGAKGGERFVELAAHHWALWERPG